MRKLAKPNRFQGGWGGEAEGMSSTTIGRKKMDEPNVWTLEEVEARLSEKWAESASDREKMAKAGWSPSPGANPNAPLVWLHNDGWWSIESQARGRDDDLCSYGIETNRIDDEGKLLGIEQKDVVHHRAHKADDRPLREGIIPRGV